MTITSGGPPLLDALLRLRAAVAVTHLTLDVPGAAAARDDQRRLLDQLDDYVLPRLRRLDAPLLAVVGGSTGAGKSTLVNSLVGERVTRSGVLRPTTRAPMLICHPDDAAWFADERILPGMTRAPGGSDAPATLGLVSSDAVPRGLALLDAPDVDSIVVENRRLARQLLDAADMWLFVTTAARYADAVPWDLLREAGERGIALAIVLDRVPAEALGEVAADLTANLEANGLGWAPLFSVVETPAVDGLLPPEAVAPLRDWLQALAADAASRDEVVRQTLAGALRTVAERARALVAAQEAEAQGAAELSGVAGSAFAAALTDTDDALRDGRVLRGEVLVRWQEFVGTGELLRTLESRIGRLRDRIAAAVTGRPPAGADLTAALETGVEALVRDADARAAQRIADAWGHRPDGASLVREHALDRPSPEFAGRAKDMVREWQHGILDIVRDTAQGKRTVARILSYGVNGAALFVMVAVFAHTGGLSGGEVAVAGGASAVGQKLLEALLGDQAVRDLAAQARSDLRRRVEELFATERARYDSVLPAPAPPALAEAAASVERATR